MANDGSNEADRPSAVGAAAPDGEALPHCPCGTDRTSRFSVARRDYAFLGLLYLLWGGTSVPRKITFQCVKCGRVFDTSTQPSVCRQYIA
jgi:hypothetical protein